MKLQLPDAASMEALGLRLAPVLDHAIVYLQGELGAGKTTLARGILRGLGHTGKVRSPTYTLVEPYALADLTVYHLDLYRLSDPEELEWLGIRDLSRGDELLLVEWPDHGAGHLPPADLVIAIEYHGAGRMLHVQALTPRGKSMAAGFNDPKRIVSS